MRLAMPIIDLRILRLRKLLQGLDKLDSPRERLCGFVQIKIGLPASAARLGPCAPNCTRTSARPRKATVLFMEALTWIEAQFKALGKGPESRGLAVHLLSATQGISLLAHAFHDPELITIEAARSFRFARIFPQRNNEHPSATPKTGSKIRPISALNRARQTETNERGSSLPK